ncbi:MAG TPA: hypothetical protein VGL89_13245 [Candidatus Koribacter sp.]|jgi:hypothetical protein
MSARSLFLALALSTFACAQAPTQSFSIGGGTIDVTLPADPGDLSQQYLMTWVHRAADAVTTYYGRFPVKHLTLKISADDRNGVHHGTTYPDQGGLIVISVGRGMKKNDFDEDWMLTHEMIHLAFPSMAHRQHWIEEGISVYVEPVARVQAGELSVNEMWFETMRDMHQGEPEPGDEGLDHTHTWGRTYWGGAMFCLMADVRIREQTHNQQGLQDALRAVMEHQGIITEDWEIERAFEIGDHATGTTVLMDLYKEMRDKPDPVDLDALWKKLGVRMEGKTAVFDPKAPDAAIREAITRKK